QRKVFRVEELAGGGRAASAGGQYDPGLSGDAGDPHPRPAAESTMAHDLSAIHSAIAGMEKATQKILASAEVIDDCARALAAALSDDYHHGLAEDVQDHVVGIYEACNFQDLAGQRIGKVITLLIMIEERLAAMIARNSGTGAQPGEASRPTGLINGPRLDGADGHASQHDIDAMFA